MAITNWGYDICMHRHIKGDWGRIWKKTPASHTPKLQAMSFIAKYRYNVIQFSPEFMHLVGVVASSIPLCLLSAFLVASMVSTAR